MHGAAKKPPVQLAFAGRRYAWPDILMSKSIKFYLLILLSTLSHIALSADYAVKANFVFIEHRKLNSQFLATVGSDDIKDHKLKRMKLEAHSESVYAEMLRTLEKNFCLDPLIEVLDEFISTLLNTANSADELPSYVFAALFACQSDMVVNKLNSLNKDDRKSVVNTLEWGFENISYKKEDTFTNFQSLSNKLNKIMHNNTLNLTPKDGAN